jgi:hypothetical protein
MQVLGDLLILPQTNDLPLPWWHRASLGLQSKTWCYVALVTNPTRRVPDIIVSVLNPYHYERTVKIRSVQPDAPGVVANVIASVPPTMNIALAESATLESGKHEVTLICEPRDRGAAIPSKDDLLREYSRVDPVPDFRYYTRRPVEWMERFEIVDGGWIRDIPWREKLLARAGTRAAEGVDLTRCVVSADTTDRLLRFVFPHEGTRTVRVKHLDHPGVLKEITDVLFRQKLNVLSMLLRRGGARPGQAILVAVCEPESSSHADAAFDRMTLELNALSGDLEIAVKTHAGVDCRDSIAPREPNTVVARVPSDLAQRYREIRAQLEKRRLAVFFSHRFTPEGEVYAQHVRRALRDSDCEVLEVSSRDDVRGQRLIFQEVSAHLWVAEAGIILVTPTADGDPVGKNIPHEYGFLQGQAKPILLMVQAGLDDAVSRWTNASGVFAPRFPSSELAFANDNPHSIHGLVRDFVNRVRAHHGPTSMMSGRSSH